MIKKGGCSIKPEDYETPKYKESQQFIKKLDFNKESPFVKNKGEIKFTTVK